VTYNNKSNNFYLGHFAVDVNYNILEKLAGKISIFSWCNNYKPSQLPMELFRNYIRISKEVSEATARLTAAHGQIGRHGLCFVGMCRVVQTTDR